MNEVKEKGILRQKQKIQTCETPKCDHHVLVFPFNIAYTLCYTYYLYNTHETQLWHLLIIKAGKNVDR